MVIAKGLGAIGNGEAAKSGEAGPCVSKQWQVAVLVTSYRPTVDFPNPLGPAALQRMIQEGNEHHAGRIVDGHVGVEDNLRVVAEVQVEQRG